MHYTQYKTYNHYKSYHENMKLIAITNQKGGVAKTTTAVNLSAALAMKGNRVLLVDSDPQANATTHLGIDINSIEFSLDNLYYEQNLPISKVIIERHGISIIPAGEPLSYADQKLSGIPGREFILAELLAPVSSQFDYVIVDCPPNLGFLTINAFTAASDLIITVKPEYFALEGIHQMATILEFVQKRLNPGVTILGYLIANYDARKNQHNGIKSSLYQFFNGQVFNTIIRTNATLSDCTSKGLTIFRYKPTSAGAMDYSNLATEIEERYGK